jgi:hypothetical protein
LILIIHLDNLSHGQIIGNAVQKLAHQVNLDLNPKVSDNI